MVNWLVMMLFGSVLVIEYLVRERGWLHPYVILLPELLSGVAVLIVLARMLAGARVHLDRRYTAFLMLLTFTIGFGFAVQDVPTGAMLAGIRAHLKFLPFFLLPAVFRFTPAQLATQFMMLLLLFAAQAPLALYQRFVEYAHMMETGDPVRGMATTSSALSLLMICGVAALVTLYLRRRIGLSLFVTAVAVFLLPTMLNETKATLLLLPIALLMPALTMPRGSKPMRRLLPIVAIGSVAIVAFVGVYDHLIQHRQNGQSIGQFVAEARFSDYLYSGAAQRDANYIGRLDSLELWLQRAGRDPLRLAFGLGAGNVSTSFLSPFDGRYAAYYTRYGVGMTEITSLLWQLGLAGVALYLLLYRFLFRDALYLARADGANTLLGQVWATVVPIMAFGLIYKAVFSMNEIGYLFWYYSGLTASFAARHQLESRLQARGRASAGAPPLGGPGIGVRPLGAGG